MKKFQLIELDPEDYDYLWTDNDVNFIFTSCYLFNKFKRTDIVLIYSHLDKGLRFYLGKSCREKLSVYGLRFYNKMFPAWEKEILRNIETGKNLIEQTRKHKRLLKFMTNTEIRKRIMERVDLFRSLGEKYFYTEFFFLGKVETLMADGEKKYKKLAERLRKMGKIKFKARKTLNHFYNYEKIFKPYIKELSFRLKRDDLPWLSYEEIIELIDGKNVFISNRDKMNWLLAKKNNWELIKGPLATRTLKIFDKHFFKRRIKIIKGFTASPGNKKGIVKIIRTIFSDDVKKEIKKVKRGDILVAATTGPEIITACRKAGGIITDEGGITSHAAIISRELNIPCVIGTKIATQVLKDGQLVEVDADHGTIKILK